MSFYNLTRSAGVLLCSLPLALAGAQTTGTVEMAKTTSRGGFEIRGLKGLFWDGIEKYRKAVPWMAEHDMNWLMLCYTMYPQSAREWRKDYTAGQLREMKELVTQANDAGITVCLSFNPGIWSNPPLCHSCEDDYKAAWRKVTAAHSIGIHWIALCLDDIHKGVTLADRERYGSLEAAQVEFVNRMWEDMKGLSPRPKLIFCPSAYTTAEMREYADYTRTVGEKLNPEIDIFWTGTGVVPATISVEDAQEVEGLIQRKPFVWDNYPVNDMFPWRPLLAPIKGRDPDLAGAVSGILFNPMKQWELNRIPLHSVASYLNNPQKYDESRAREETIESFPEDQREAISLLMKYYGSSFVGEKNYPPGPKSRTMEQAKAVAAELTKLRDLMTTHPELKLMWGEIRETAEPDLEAAQMIMEAPLVDGARFKGGAPKLAEQAFGEPMGLVYARPTGVRSKMSVVLPTESFTTAPTRLRLMARNSTQRKPRVRITLDGKKLHEGMTEVSHERFEKMELNIPPGTIRDGKLTLQINNLESSGTAGQPPWLAVKWIQFLP